MKKIYLGMGCFWSTQSLFFKNFPNKKSIVGYVNNIEVLETTYEDKEDFFNILKFFFENQSFKHIEIPYNYISCIFFEDVCQLNEIKYMLNHYNRKIKISGQIGYFNTKISLIDNFIIADEYNQNYLEKNKDLKCTLKSNGIVY